MVVLLVVHIYYSSITVEQIYHEIKIVKAMSNMTDKNIIYRKKVMKVELKLISILKISKF